MAFLEVAGTGKSFAPPQSLLAWHQLQFTFPCFFATSTQPLTVGVIPPEQQSGAEKAT